MKSSAYSENSGRSVHKRTVPSEFEQDAKNDEKNIKAAVIARYGRKLCFFRKFMRYSVNSFIYYVNIALVQT